MKKKRADELFVRARALREPGGRRTPDHGRKSPQRKRHTGRQAIPAFRGPTPSFLVDSGGEFVSRGAYKLRDSLDKFRPPTFTGGIAADVGASTGGFTDLMLSRGAEKVYAVDVGRGLLHWKLRSDARVVCLEGVNARTLSPELVPEKVDLLSMDVSFIFRHEKSSLPPIRS